MTSIHGYHFNWVDYTIIGILAFSILLSFIRGFLREAISLVTWLVALLLSLKFSPLLQHYLQPWIASQMLRYAVAFMAIFLTLFLCGIVINFIVHAIVKKTGLSLTDRFFGIFFGAARGLVVVAVILLFFSVGTSQDNAVISQSLLAPHFQPVVKWLGKFLPKQMTVVSQWVESGANPIKLFSEKGN